MQLPDDFWLPLSALVLCLEHTNVTERIQKEHVTTAEFAIRSSLPIRIDPYLKQASALSPGAGFTRYLTGHPPLAPTRSIPAPRT